MSSAIIPETMQAMVCDGPGHPLELRQMPTPRPAQGQLLVKLETCGICHSYQFSKAMTHKPILGCR